MESWYIELLSANDGQQKVATMQDNGIYSGPVCSFVDQNLGYCEAEQLPRFEVGWAAGGNRRPRENLLEAMAKSPKE